jgi:hypothetical protein
MSVGKDAAVALKKVGFDCKCDKFYKRGIVPLYNADVTNHNHWEDSYSAPTHLDAADWFFQNHALEFEFGAYRTKIFCHNTGDWIGKFGEADGNHRDAAILHACKIIKERK